MIMTVITTTADTIRYNDDDRYNDNRRYNDNDRNNTGSQQNDYNSDAEQHNSGNETVYFDNSSLNNVQDRSQVIKLDGNGNSVRINEGVAPISEQPTVPSSSNRSNEFRQYQSRPDGMPRYDERHGKHNPVVEPPRDNNTTMPDRNSVSGNEPRNNKRHIINLSNRPYHAEDFER